MSETVILWVVVMNIVLLVGLFVCAILMGRATERAEGISEQRRV